MDAMTIEKCSVRIAKALSIRNMKQSDLCRKTNIPKSAMSQYLSGAFEPKQDRLHIIAKALNVSPVWLMGFDVPMEENTTPPPENIQLSEGEKALLNLFRRVPESQQQLVLQMIQAALGSQ
jgi:transcriptional regulator with XRE-family HTH domain